MGVASWITGVGLPTLFGGGLVATALFVWFRVPGVGHHLGMALAVLGTASVSYAWGYSARAKDDRSATLSAQVRSLEKTLAETQRLQARHAEDVRAARAIAAENKRKADALLEKLASTPVLAACSFTPSERGRLQRITIGRPDAATGQPRDRILPRSGRVAQPQDHSPRPPSRSLGVRGQAAAGG